MKTAFAFVTSAVVVFGAGAAVKVYVEKLVDRHVSEPGFLHGLSRQVRPVVIFDKTESTIADQGAADLIENIDVSPGPDEHHWTVTVSFSEHFAVEPILESLDGRFNITGHRGRMRDWVFEMEAAVLLAVVDTGEPFRPGRFRLEVIR
jgi:hypothetical protein